MERDKNIDALIELGMLQSEVPGVLKGMTVKDYSEGPLQDRQGRDREWWVFGPAYDGKLLYIKVGITGGRVECLSFHKAEYQLVYPFRGGGDII